MKKSGSSRIVLSLFLPIGVLFLIAWWGGNAPNTLEDAEITDANCSPIPSEKQKGAHVFARFDTTNFEYLKRNNIEWVTLVPWAFQDDFNSAFLSFHRGDTLMLKRRDSSWMRRIERARDAGFKVFVKPHIWLHEPTQGSWRSDIFPDNEADWAIWQERYRDFIFHYASLAEAAGAEMFCIGTELTRLSLEKPEFWKSLIPEIRSIYSGKITYAANWYKEYENLTFWGDLDYIGIQAYFPLVKNEYPSVQQISEGWKKYIPKLESIHKKYNRQILFTELGYKSTSDSAVDPWTWIEDPASQNKPSRSKPKPIATRLSSKKSGLKIGLQAYTSGNLRAIMPG